MTTRAAALVVAFSLGTGCQSPPVSPTASDTQAASDATGTADMATTSAGGHHHHHGANPGTPELEGGGALEASLIPPGSGWWCYSAVELPSGTNCFRTEAACKAEQGPRAKEQRGTVNGEPDVPTACERTTPFCFTGAATGQEHKLYCQMTKERCVNNLRGVLEQGDWSGCAAVP